MEYNTCYAMTLTIMFQMYIMLTQYDYCRNLLELYLRHLFVYMRVVRYIGV